jgi:hypothetical protein
MKRHNHLFEQIVDYNNIRLAFLKTIRGNRSSPSVINFCQNTGKNLELLRDMLLSMNISWGNYRSFPIHDPKLRIISTAPIEQRIMHHAIINIIGPILERPLIFHSYACRKEKGTHAAVLYAFEQCKTKPCFLKLDIRKYFDSLDHVTLKNQLRRLIKDTRVITLLDGIIDSYETLPGVGVPIGNLTSQYFSNLYLSGLDHYILEQLHPFAYCRYMDDFIIWSTAKELKTIYESIYQYVTQKLYLYLKQPVFGKTTAGLPFLGFLIKDKGIYLLRKSKRRVTVRLSEITALFCCETITEAKAAERARSVFAAISLARTNNFRRKLCVKGERLRTKSSMVPTV